jgi:hypothetical protein
MDSYGYNIGLLPSLVDTRRQLTDDPSGPYGPGAEWLPNGWESDTYPIFDNIESVRQWLHYEMQRAEESDGHPGDENGCPPGGIPGVDLFYVRDAYRLVEHLEKKRKWTSVPREPERRYTSTVGDYREVATELRKVLGWVNEQIAVTQATAPTPADGTGGDPPESESAVLDDPITLEDAATLVLAAVKTIQNRGTEGRPKPAIGGGKGKRAIWGYHTLRPWLLDKFPDYEDRLPEDYAEAKKLFSAPKCPPGNS